MIDIDKKYFHELKGFLEPSECKSIRDKFFDLFEINKDTMEEKQEHRKHFFSLRNSDVFKKIGHSEFLSMFIFKAYWLCGLSTCSYKIAPGS